MSYEYNALLKEGLQKKAAGAFPSGVVATVDEVNSLQGVTGNVQTQLNELHTDSKDLDVYNLAEFIAAVNESSATNSIRIHFKADIALTADLTLNLENTQIYGHDKTLWLENHALTLTGSYCYFYQVRIGASSSVTADAAPAGSYENAHIYIISNVSSSRFFFEYVIFRNFVNHANEMSDILMVSNNSGVNPSLHLFFMFCEVMTNYTQEDIATGCWCVNNYGNRLHALTVHNIDFWGNATGEENHTLNFSFRGNMPIGAAKLAYISDGSGVYATVSGSLTPNAVNQYNPSFQEFNALKDILTNLIILNTISDTHTSTYQTYTATCTYNIYYNKIFAFVTFYVTGSCPPGSITYNINLNIINSFYFPACSDANQSQIYTCSINKVDNKFNIQMIGSIGACHGSVFIPLAQN